MILREIFSNLSWQFSKASIYFMTTIQQMLLEMSYGYYCWGSENAIPKNLELKKSGRASEIRMSFRFSTTFLFTSPKCRTLFQKDTALLLMLTGQEKNLDRFFWVLPSNLLPLDYIFFLIIMLGGGTLWHLQNFLQYIKYIILELTPSIILLYHPSSHSWNFCLFIF
jgi:hypothetical protein